MRIQWTVASLKREGAMVSRNMSCFEELRVAHDRQQRNRDFSLTTERIWILPSEWAWKQILPLETPDKSPVWATTWFQPVRPQAENSVKASQPSDLQNSKIINRGDFKLLNLLSSNRKWIQSSGTRTPLCKPSSTFPFSEFVLLCFPFHGPRKHYPGKYFHPTLVFAYENKIS